MIVLDLPEYSSFHLFLVAGNSAVAVQYLVNKGKLKFRGNLLQDSTPLFLRAYDSYCFRNDYDEWQQGIIREQSQDTGNSTFRETRRVGSPCTIRVLFASLSALREPRTVRPSGCDLINRLTAGFTVRWTYPACYLPRRTRSRLHIW